MFPSIDPKKMQAMMKQLGIAQEEIDGDRVIIEGKNSKKIIIENPSIMKIKMQGQESFQISGNSREEIAGSSSEDDEIGKIVEEDIKTIMEKTKCSEKEARKALENSDGDLTEAILKLT
ncbi:MAG: nascent polypeptide-associated complex protein [Nanoarchaeota archaeon]